MISIIIPMHNAEKTIKRTIQSVMDQDFQDYEIILIDDQSTDNTCDICNEIIKENNNKIIKIFKINKSGPSKARNVGLENAIGKYIMFLDADDYYESNMLKIMNNYAENKENALICCNYYEVYDKIKKESKSLKSFEITEKDSIYKGIELLQKNFKFNTLWNKIYYKKIIDENNIRFDENINMGEDYKFNITYCFYIDSIHYINNCLYNYVISSNSLCATYDKTNEFNRRIENINHNRKMYKKKNYPLDSIYNKYISSLVGTAEVLISLKKMTFKEKIKEISEYAQYKELKDILKIKFNIDKKNRIIYYFLKTRNYKLIYIYVWIRTKVKKIIYKLKGKKYRK